MHLLNTVLVVFPEPVDLCCKSDVQALDIDATLPLPLFGMAQLMSNQAGGVDKALANLEKALDKVALNFCLLQSMPFRHELCLRVTFASGVTLPCERSCHKGVQCGLSCTAGRGCCVKTTVRFMSRRCNSSIKCVVSGRRPSGLRH